MNQFTLLLTEESREWVVLHLLLDLYVYNTQT